MGLVWGAWLPAYRTLMVWVHDGSRSLLVTILMHVSLVASLVILEPALTGEALLTYILIRAAVLWVIVATVIVIGRRSASRVQARQPGMP